MRQNWKVNEKHYELSLRERLMAARKKVGLLSVRLSEMVSENARPYRISELNCSSNTVGTNHWATSPNDKKIEEVSGVLKRIREKVASGDLE